MYLSDGVGMRVSAWLPCHTRGSCQQPMEWYCTCCLRRRLLMNVYRETSCDKSIVISIIVVARILTVEHECTKMSDIAGYRGLARFMVRDKDRSPCIFRRFDGLGLRNLLYLQSELLSIENRLEALDIAHVQAPLNVKAALRDWNSIKAEGIPEPWRCQVEERVQLVHELKLAMREYRTIAK